MIKSFTDFVCVVHRPGNVVVSVCLLGMLDMAPSPPVLRIQSESITQRGHSK